VVNVYYCAPEEQLNAEMSSYWPKMERTVCSWEKIKADQDTDTIIIDDDDGKWMILGFPLLTCPLDSPRSG